MPQFVTNLDLFMALKASGKVNNSEFLYNTLVSGISSEISVEDLKILRRFSQTYSSNLNKRWLKVNRCQKNFFTNNMGWLESTITWPSCSSIDLVSIFSQEIMELQENLDVSLDTVEVGPSTSEACTNTPVQRKPFEDISNKHKKRRSISLLEYSEEELLFAVVLKLKESGNKELAALIDYLRKDVEKTKKVYENLFIVEPKKSLPIDETLALVTELKLSKWQYQTLATNFAQNDVAVLPSYAKLLTEKKCCYPNTEDVTVSETGANIKLEAVLDLTTKRIFKVIGQNLHSGSLKLISKWGCDGSSSHSTYKQKHHAREGFSDASVFMTSIVPLRLMHNDNIVWENPRPSSTQYCRPKMFEFVKESKEYIQEHTAAMNEEIDNLIPTSIGDLLVNHVLHMTMIDGKVATALSETQSHANCNICLATPKEMNNLSLVSNKPIVADMFKYGLSSLHMWIRCMECILHISYNLDFKKWSARGDDKLLQKSRKELTQDELFKQTGLLVDIVKQGFGTTNDGNTARRFFRDYQKTSDITGVDVNLIKNFAVILQTISSGENININRFREYCKNTAEHYINLYPWYYMPSSVHKLLIHGAEICEHFSFIPVGMLSELASEARNKDFRNIRERHSRKIGRTETNQDILNYFLVSSDPYITHLRPKFKLPKMELLAEAAELLLEKLESEMNTEEEEVIIDLVPNLTADPLE